MDKFLKPERFDADPNSSTATVEWRHWLHTFENFLKSLSASKPDELQVLTNYVAPSVYSLIADCADYASALKTLKDAFDIPKNEIFARHLLATRKQQPGETIEQFLQTLHSLSKDCIFKVL